MLAAEREAEQAILQGIYEWSPYLEHAERVYTYWKTRLSLIINKLPIPPSLAESQEALKLISTSNSKSYVQAKLYTTRQELRSTQRKAKYFRQQHLEILVSIVL